MELAALKTFARVVQTGSFTRAADSLDSHKAHVSRVVSELERELGVRLLERSTRALSLTEVGREFHERAQSILASVEEAGRVVQRSQGTPRGLLKLTCGVEFGMLAVADWVAQYLARYPDTRVDADFTNRVVDIVHEGFDVAVRVGPLQDSSLAARRIGDIHYGLFAAPAYLRLARPPATPAALAGHHLLAYLGGAHRMTWALQRAGETARVEATPRLSTNNVGSVRDAAIAGLGIAALPEIVARAALADGSLQRVLPEWRPAPVPVHAVFASARYLTPKVRAFVDLAVAAFQGDSATLNPTVATRQNGQPGDAPPRRRPR